MTEDLREIVRQRYAGAAAAVAAGGSGCCGSDAAGAPEALEPDERFGSARYTQLDRDSLPVGAVAASLGCGNPIAVAELQPGDRVLDLGSGGGIDAILAAGRVGPTGFVYGVDMTPEMIDLARANAAQAGVRNAGFLAGTVEDIPLPVGTVDVVISNCVINLSTDKPAALTEMFRVLAPGGRIAVSDVVAEDHLTPAQRAERGSYVGCIAGALSGREYLDGLAAAGFVDASVDFTHPVAEQMHSAIVRATKPGATRPADDTVEVGGSAAPSPAAGASCCTPAEAETCCEPTAKAECCQGDLSQPTSARPSGCGCR